MILRGSVSYSNNFSLIAHLVIETKEVVLFTDICYAKILWKRHTKNIVRIASLKIVRIPTHCIEPPPPPPPPHLP